MNTTTGYAHVSVNHRDRNGNAGMTESLGISPTMEEAKRIGENYATAAGETPGTLYWNQAARDDSRWR